MPDDLEPTSQKQVTLIPCDRIRILNPRVRNRRTFEAMMDNIGRIGLKRPHIFVTDLLRPYGAALKEIGAAAA